MFKQADSAMFSTWKKDMVIPCFSGNWGKGAYRLNLTQSRSSAAVTVDASDAAAHKLLLSCGSKFREEDGLLNPLKLGTKINPSELRDRAVVMTTFK